MTERYEIVKKLGKGGMGSVYLVLDKRLGKHWVMKVWREGDPRKTGYWEECLALRDMDSAFFPRIVDVFRENGKMYLVMDWVRGITLEEYILQKGRLSLKETLSYGIQICEAVQTLHGRMPPMLHLDLKPSNIMLTEDGIRLIDFGSALSGWEGICPHSGTLGYAPPEQLRPAGRKAEDRAGRDAPRGDRHGGVDERSDIYSLGAVLLSMLTGRPPENGKGLEGRMDVPDRWKRLIRRAMEPEAARRFQSVEEMKRELLRTDKKAWPDIMMHLLKRGISVLLLGWAAYRGAGSFLDRYRILTDGGKLWEMEGGRLLEGIRPILLCCLWEWLAMRSHRCSRSSSRGSAAWYEQEKNKIRTDSWKQIWLGVCGGILAGMLMMLPMEAIYAGEGSLEGRGRLSVILRDAYMRKLLIQTGKACVTDGPLYLEIPRELLEDGRVLQICVTARYDGGSPLTYSFSCQGRAEGGEDPGSDG